MKEEDDITIETFQIEEWDGLTETIPTTLPSLFRLRHTDGTYIGVGLDHYPQRGHGRTRAAAWRSREEARRYNEWWGGEWTVEEDRGEGAK